MGSYLPCNRRHCRDDLTMHRRSIADSGPNKGQLLIGACHRANCECSQYVGEGLETTNNVRGVYGDAGMVATRELLELGLPLHPDDPLNRTASSKPNSARTPRPQVAPQGLWLPPSYRE